MTVLRASLLGWGVVRDRGLWRWLALAAGLGLACVVNTAIAQDRHVSFDIPRQILAGANAFTFVATASAAEMFTTPRYSEYSTALQAALTSVLCRFRQTWPLDYRLAVAPSGAVQYVKFLDTTGDAGRDAVLEALFRRVVVGEAPPSNLSQPTTVLILPRRDAAAECLAMGVGVTR
jgi:hypothetical protein